MSKKAIRLLIVEDNPKLRPALREGLASIDAVSVSDDCDSGEIALELSLSDVFDAILMDVQLAGRMNGIEAAVAIRREFPRMPVVFYSIQDDDDYYRHFRRSGILTHFAYVRKSNYLLPTMLIPLIRDGVKNYRHAREFASNGNRRLDAICSASELYIHENGVERVAQAVFQRLLATLTIIYNADLACCFQTFA